MVADAAGLNLYIAEAEPNPANPSSSGNHGNRVRRVDLTTGFITTLAGSTSMNSATCTTPQKAAAGDGAPSVNSTLCLPSAVAMSAAGDLLIADGLNARVRKVHLATGTLGNIDTMAGTIGQFGSSGNGGPPLVAKFCQPFGLAVDSFGRVIVTDAQCHNVRTIDAAETTVSGLAGNGNAGFGGDGAAARDATMYAPAHVAVSANASLVYFSDYDNDRIRVVGP
jgi:hypothetical protein